MLQTQSIFFSKITIQCVSLPLCPVQVHTCTSQGVWAEIWQSHSDVLAPDEVDPLLMRIKQLVPYSPS